MQIEVISENSYYIYMTADELDGYSLKSSELLYGSQAYRKLTASVLRELETYHGFSKNGDPLRIELSPGAFGDIYMTVETFDEADEMDPRFCTYSISDYQEQGAEGATDENEEDDDEEDVGGDITVEDAEDDADFAFSSHAGSSSGSSISPESIAGAKVYLTFPSYEALTTAIGAVNASHFSGISSVLYLDSKTKALYVTLSLPSKPSILYKDLMVLLEYSKMALLDGATMAYLEEHCKRITASPIEKLQT